MVAAERLCVAMAVVGVLRGQAGAVAGAASPAVEALRRYVSQRAYKELQARMAEPRRDSAADIFLQVATTARSANQAGAAEGVGSDVDPYMIPGAKDCFGVKSEMCKAKPSPEQNEADVIVKTCDNLLCNPICLAIGLKCKVTGGSGEFAAAGEHPVSTALCGQFIAQACVDWTCCEKDADELTTWVEDKTISDAYPEMQLPVCRHDPVDGETADALCSQCKASGVSLSFSLNADGCKFGEGANPAGGARRLLGYLRARGDLKRKGLLAAAMAHDAHRRAARRGARAAALLEEGASLPNDSGFPGIGTMKSFREMCDKVVGSMSPGTPQGAATPAKVCECMGCCDPGGDGKGYCMFPFFEQNGDPSMAS